MKKLNRKGFTLIELLAVIVIMGIILIVTVPNVIESINNARIQSLWNLSKSTANTYEKIYTESLVIPNTEIGKVEAALTTNWQCINTVNTKLADLLGLSKNEINLDSKNTEVPVKNGAIDEKGIISTTCSAIKRNANGGVDVLLVAKTGGRFAVSGSATYALSTASTGKTNAGV